MSLFYETEGLKAKQYKHILKFNKCHGFEFALISC